MLCYPIPIKILQLFTEAMPKPLKLTQFLDCHDTARCNTISYEKFKDVMWEKLVAFSERDGDNTNVSNGNGVSENGINEIGQMRSKGWTDPAKFYIPNATILPKKIPARSYDVQRYIDEVYKALGGEREGWSGYSHTSISLSDAIDHIANDKRLSFIDFS